MCIAVEDSPLGIVSAKLAGMKCIAVTTSHSPEELKNADIIIRNLDIIRKLKLNI